MGHTSLPRRADQRKHARKPVAGKLRILWNDETGAERLGLAELVNVSRFGLQIRLDNKLTRGTQVMCNDRALGISGRGSVRYCDFSKGKYVIGLEFSSGTGWTEPKDAEVSQVS